MDKQILPKANCIKYCIIFLPLALLEAFMDERLMFVYMLSYIVDNHL